MFRNGFACRFVLGRDEKTDQKWLGYMIDKCFFQSDASRIEAEPRPVEHNKRFDTYRQAMASLGRDAPADWWDAVRVPEQLFMFRNGFSYVCIIFEQYVLVPQQYF